MSGRAKTTLEPIGGPKTNGPPIDLRHVKYGFGIPSYVKRDVWQAGMNSP